MDEDHALRQLVVFGSLGCTGFVNDGFGANQEAFYTWIREAALRVTLDNNELGFQGDDELRQQLLKLDSLVVDLLVANAVFIVVGAMMDSAKGVDEGQYFKHLRQLGVAG